MVKSSNVYLSVAVVHSSHQFLRWSNTCFRSTIIILCVPLNMKPATTACRRSIGKWVSTNAEQASHATRRVLSYVGQSVVTLDPPFILCLTTDWTTGVRSQAEAKNFSVGCVKTSSEAHPASNPMGTGHKARPGRDADTHPSLVLGSRMKSCTSSPP
jgi:hypothetical protein